MRIDDTQKARLEKLAKSTGRPAAFYIRQALDTSLDRMEYIYRLEQDAIALRRGELETLPLEELVAECGLED